MTELYATAALGTEDLVAKELRGLGFDAKRGRGGASFAGGDDPIGAAMKACLHLRAAMRVLLPLKSVNARSADELYEAARRIPWERWIETKTTFAITATTSAPPPLAHAPFLGQKVKDALVDRLREKRGERPDVNRDDPDVRVYVHLDRNGAGAIGLDASGESLHQRGYRIRATPAPLKETLAASIVLASGWQADRPLLDPLCGSGTIAIEAALLARKIAPGRRRKFGFERWPGFDAPKWKALVDEAIAAELPASPVPIFASDRDPEAVEVARANARSAGVQIAVEQRDVRDVIPLEPPGVILANPPYGERISEVGEGLEVFYRQLGQTLRKLDGHTAFLLVPPGLAGVLGMRPTWERKLKNGPLDVTLCRFELGRKLRG